MTTPVEPSGNIPNLGGLGPGSPTSYDFPRAYGGHGLAPGLEFGYYGPTYNIAYDNPGLGYGPGSDISSSNWYGPNIGAYNPVIPPGGKKTASRPAHRLSASDYNRTDEQIHAAIALRLADDPRVDARSIDVHVDQGVVTLTGRVLSRGERQRAARDADANRGVWAVHNRLRVGPVGAPRRFSITP